VTGELSLKLYTGIGYYIKSIDFTPFVRWVAHFFAPHISYTYIIRQPHFLRKNKREEGGITDASSHFKER
jgi:hypothetical protein